MRRRVKWHLSPIPYSWGLGWEGWWCWRGRLKIGNIFTEDVYLLSSWESDILFGRRSFLLRTPLLFLIIVPLEFAISLKLLFYPIDFYDFLHEWDDEALLKYSEGNVVVRRREQWECCWWWEGWISAHNCYSHAPSFYLLCHCQRKTSSPGWNPGLELIIPVPRLTPVGSRFIYGFENVEIEIPNFIPT